MKICPSSFRGGYESHNHKAELLSHDLKADKSELKKVIARGEVRNGLLNRVGKEQVQWGTMVTGFEKTAAGMRVKLTCDGQEKSL